MRVQVLPGAVIVEIGRIFGVQQVGQLERRLGLLGPIGHVVVDFSSAREVEDCAVWKLADALRRLAGSVSLHSLSLHHQRMLRYCGHRGPYAGRARRLPGGVAPVQATLERGEEERS
jgi:hypothetical protein